MPSCLWIPKVLIRNILKVRSELVRCENDEKTKISYAEILIENGKKKSKDE